MYDYSAISTGLVAATAAIRSLPRAASRPLDRTGFLRQFQVINDAANEIVRVALASVEPDVGWLDLESDGGSMHDFPAGSWWVCDPIDGAVQLVQGIEQWCVSLALVVDGVVTAAWVYDPVQNELFHAVLGQGATLDGVPIRAAGKHLVADAVLAMSHAPGQNDDNAANALAGASYSAALHAAGAVRNLGPTSLQIAWVAAGRLDGFWSHGADAANWLAGDLIATEAGGIATDMDGAELAPGSESLLVSGERLHESLRAVLRRPVTPLTIDGRTAREFVLGMATDCFPPTNIGAAEATERWTMREGYRQTTNGVSITREEQVQHLAFLQSHVESMDFEILHAVFDGETLAVLQRVDVRTGNGDSVESEVAAFFTIRDGRIVETDELTRAIDAPSVSQQIHTAR